MNSKSHNAVPKDPLLAIQRMEGNPIVNVLLIEDNPGDARLIQEMLVEGGGTQYTLECVDRLATGLARLVANDIGLVLLDLGLPDSQGFETFARVYAETPRVPIIVLSGLADENLAIKTVQKGAQDYIVKGQVDSYALVRTIRYAIERKHVEEELRSQALIFENIHDSIVVTDLEGNIIRWNPAAERMFGYYEDEVFQKTLGMLATRIVTGQLRDGRWTGEMNFTRKDETEGICETTVIPLRDEHDNITAVFGVSHDITEQKRAEKALLESERKLRFVTDQVSDVIWSMDLKGNFTFITPSTERMIGYTVKEMLSMNLKQILTPESNKMVIDLISRGMKTGKKDPIVLELQQVCKDGSKMWCEVTAIFATDDNRPSGIIGVTRDISERKRSEAKLQRSYDKLRDTMIATVNTLASTVEMRDPYTAGHQRRVTILACAMAEEMGLTEEQFDGLRMAGLIHDIGKISVPVEILNKPGRLSRTEFDIIKSHPQAGYNILQEIELPWPVNQIILQHHERLDGSGYPQGLKNGGIMLEAKIVAVADVVEAMASHRPYRPALGIEAALEEITKNQGILYEPEMVDICKRLFIEKGFTFE